MKGGKGGLVWGKIAVFFCIQKIKNKTKDNKEGKKLRIIEDKINGACKEGNMEVIM